MVACGPERQDQQRHDLMLQGRKERRTEPKGEVACDPEQMTLNAEQTDQ